MPPSAAIAEASANAKSLAVTMLMPSAAAARSLVRTAIRRRPLRPLRTLATTSTVRSAMPSTKMPYRSGCLIELISKPNRLGLPTGVPLMPPVKSPLLNSISSIAVPRPSVTIARLIPRVRTAGSAKTSPSGTAAATPATSASRNGMWNTATRRPATHAPKPAIAYCASESWPAYPVTTTIDSSTIAAHNVTVSASIHFVSFVSIRNTTTPARKIVQSHEIRPLPIAGSLRR